MHPPSHNRSAKMSLLFCLLSSLYIYIYINPTLKLTGGHSPSHIGWCCLIPDALLFIENFEVIWCLDRNLRLWCVATLKQFNTWHVFLFWTSRLSFFFFCYFVLNWPACFSAICKLYRNTLINIVICEFAWYWLLFWPLILYLI
jgi:predicted MFS family arabinose efflux permease